MLAQPCPYIVVNTLGCYDQLSVTHLSSSGSKLNPGASALHQRIISNNSHSHDEQGQNPGQKKRVRQCPLLSATVVDALISNVKVVSRAGVDEAKRHHWPLTGITHSAS